MYSPDTDTEIAIGSPFFDQHYEMFFESYKNCFKNLCIVNRVIKEYGAPRLSPDSTRYM